MKYMFALFLCLSLSSSASNDQMKFGMSCDKDEVEVSRQSDSCDPAVVVMLADYPQWRAEKGYWIGECTLYNGDGEPYTSVGWPYRYSGTKSFITGNIAGSAYRQRNVFLYPPQSESNEMCKQDNPEVVGEGECGKNGNSLVFFADQAATSCSDNPALAGNIDGPFQSQFGPLYTTTELIGQDNALLYQVFLPPHMNPIQSQLTTLTKGPGSDEFNYRTRTAQGFDFATGLQTYLSFYRERKVSKQDFYAEMNKTIAEFNILDSDLCYLDGGAGRQPIDGYRAGYEQCVTHLQASFDLV